MAPILAKPEHSPTQLVLKNEKKNCKASSYIVRKSHYASYIVTITQCSKIGKKVQFQKYKKTLFAFSKMARNQFLQ